MSPVRGNGTPSCVRLSGLRSSFTEAWEQFQLAPSELSAAGLQRKLLASRQDAVELDALRFRLALVLPSGTADPELVERLQVLELRLRSPQSQGGHLGPPSPSR